MAHCYYPYCKIQNCSKNKKTETILLNHPPNTTPYLNTITSHSLSTTVTLSLFPNTTTTTPHHHHTRPHHHHTTPQHHHTSPSPHLTITTTPHHHHRCFYRVQIHMQLCSTMHFMSLHLITTHQSN